MSPRGDGPLTSRIRARRNGEQGQIPTKPPYLRRTPPWAKSRRTQEAARRRWAKVEQTRVRPHHHWFLLGPNFIGRFIPPLQGWSRWGWRQIQCLGRFVPSMWGDPGNIPRNTPLLSTYKRRTSPPSFQQHPRSKSYTTREIRASLLV